MKGMQAYSFLLFGYFSITKFNIKITTFSRTQYIYQYNQIFKTRKLYSMNQSSNKSQCNEVTLYTYMKKDRNSNQTYDTGQTFLKIIL